MKNLLIFLCGIAAGIGLLYTYILKDAPVNKPTTKIAFSIKKPPSESIEGIVNAYSGEIWWESREATQGAQLTKNVAIHQGEWLQTKQGSATVMFPQVGNVVLAEQTKITFVQTLPLNLVMQQTEGKAVYTREGKIPVSIRALHALIDLRTNETTATVTVDSEAQTVIITAKSGEAIVAYNDLSFTSQQHLLKKNDTLLFDDTTREAGQE